MIPLLPGGVVAAARYADVEPEQRASSSPPSSASALLYSNTHLAGVRVRVGGRCGVLVRVEVGKKKKKNDAAKKNDDAAGVACSCASRWGRRRRRMAMRRRMMMRPVWRARARRGYVRLDDGRRVRSLVVGDCGRACSCASRRGGRGRRRMMWRISGEPPLTTTSVTASGCSCASRRGRMNDSNDAAHIMITSLNHYECNRQWVLVRVKAGKNE